MKLFKQMLAALLSLSLTGFGMARTGVVQAGDGADRVTVCHHAGPTRQLEIEVTAAAVAGHLRHGDSVGACNGGGPA